MTDDGRWDWVRIGVVLTAILNFVILTGIAAGVGISWGRAEERDANVQKSLIALEMRIDRKDSRDIAGREAVANELRLFRMEILERLRGLP